MAEGLREAALEYYRLGFNVVAGKGKQPLVKWQRWITERQTPEEFNAQPWGEADSFAVVCGTANSEGYSLAVVDFDVKNMAAEAQNLGREALKHMPVTRIEETPSKGQHWVYLSKAKPKTISSYHEKAALELLGEGKLCFMAPSLGYKRLNDNLPTKVDNVEAMFLEALRKVGVTSAEGREFEARWFNLESERLEAYEGEDPPCVKRLLKGVSIGMRNEATIRLSSYLVNFKRLSPGEAREKLKRWNKRNRPPLDEAELENV